MMHCRGCSRKEVLDFKQKLVVLFVFRDFKKESRKSTLYQWIQYNEEIMGEEIISISHIGSNELYLMNDDNVYYLYNNYS